MAVPLIMPRFGMTQTEATIVRWLKQEGEAVEAGEPVLEVSTDKVVMDVEAPDSGILRGLRYRADAVVPVTETIAYIAAPGEPWTPPAEATTAAATPPPAAPEPVKATPLARRMAAEQGVDLATVAGGGPGGRVTSGDVQAYLSAGPEKVRATPAARRAAREGGLDLAQVAGSGPRGRVQAADVAAALARPAPAAASETVVPLAGMRRTIAGRMAESARTAPHIELQIDVDMARAEALRQAFNAAGEVKVSTTAQIVKACAWALGRHPYLNATLRDDGIHLLPQANVGVAVALAEGLIVPVVHDAGRKGVAEIAAEIAELSRRAREGRLGVADVTGGTFTVSNLGMLGIDRFKAIINPPESAILAVGRIVRRPVVGDGDSLVIHPIMTVNLSADHRVVDGAVAARFLADLRQALEEPGWLAY